MHMYMDKRYIEVAELQAKAWKVKASRGFDNVEDTVYWQSARELADMIAQDAVYNKADDPVEPTFRV